MTLIDRLDRSLFALVATLSIVSCGEGGKSDKILLRYHPPAGAVYHYTLEQRTAISMESGPLAGMGRQEFQMRLHFTQIVKGAAPSVGGTEVEMTFDSMTMNMPGVPADAIRQELARLRGLKSSMVLDERGQVTRASFTPPRGVSPQVATQMTAGIKAMTFSFPEQRVGIGDSWTIPTELPVGQLPGADPSKVKPAQTTLTVRDIQATGSDTVVVLDVSTAFPEDPVDLDIGGERASMKLLGMLSGDQQFSVTRGTVTGSSMRGQMTMHVTAAALGPQVMIVSSDTENVLRLLDSK